MDFNPADFDPSHDYRITFNGVDVPIEIEDEGGRVSPQQLEALQQALSLSPDVLEKSAPAVVQNYEVYREMIGDEEMPPLAHPVDVWKAVHPTEITIPFFEEETPTGFLLMAECDWDVEHGLVVRFRDGVADASSQQGELGLQD